MVLWCIIMSRSVMQKDWLAIFKVKVTARAHMIKIWQFLLYLLNCWSFCYQTWFDCTYHKLELDCYVQGQGHSKMSKSRWMFVQMIFSESLNLLLPDLVWWCIIMSQIVLKKKNCSAVFKVKVTVKNNMFKICLFNIWTADPFASKLGLMAHHHRVDCLVKRLDCSAVVKVTEKVQNSSECSSGRYLLSCWTFCNQTWYGNASSWARVSWKKIGYNFTYCTCLTDASFPA